MNKKHPVQFLRKSALRRLARICDDGHTTVRVLHRTEFPGQSRSAAESWLQRMIRAGWLRAGQLDELQVYYRPTLSAVQCLKKVHRMQVSRACIRPLTPNRKYEKHARLLYCSHDAVSRSAYRPSKDDERFPDIAAHIAQGKADPMRHKLFYREGDTVGLLLADRGQSSFIHSKVRPKVFSIFRWESFQRLAELKQFRLTIITTTEYRRRELVRECAQNAPPMPHEIVVIEELATLLPSLPSNKRS